MTNVDRVGTPKERLERRLVRQPNDCLEYGGYRTPDGYGMIWNAGTMTITSRLTWALAYGPIPDGLWVLHTCDNPPCCNIEHLFLGTSNDNVADKVAKGRCHNQQKTHCMRGHAFDEANTRYKEGRRQCRACGRAEVQARRAKNR